MIEKIDITATGVVDSIRNKMEVATVTNKGLMSNDGFILRSDAIKTSNYNDLTLSGTHRIDDPRMEAENGPGINYGILCVFSTRFFVFQIAASIMNNVVKYRTRSEYASGWSSWANM